MFNHETEYMSLSEVAKTLGVSRDAVKMWVRRGLLPVPVYRTPGGHIRIRRSDVSRIYSSDSVIRDE